MDAIDILVQEQRDTVMAQEILRLLDEEKNHIKLMTRGDFNFLLFNRPEIYENIFSYSPI